MPFVVQPGSRFFSTVFGLLMVGSAGVAAHGVAVVAGVVAAIAVGVGVLFRPAATLAVLLSVSAILLSDPSHVWAGLSGLCAAGYLVCRFGAGAAANVVMGGWPTIFAAIGFSFAGLAATSFPLQLPWLPLLAPLGVLARGASSGKSTSASRLNTPSWRRLCVSLWHGPRR